MVVSQNENIHVSQVVDRIVVLRRGQKVADDIDPQKTTIAEVEKVITGLVNHVGEPSAA